MCAQFLASAIQFAFFFKVKLTQADASVRDKLLLFAYTLATYVTATVLVDQTQKDALLFFFRIEATICHGLSFPIIRC